MILISVISVTLAALLLLLLIVFTRQYDTPAWWLFRVLSGYALVCFIYLAYDTSVAGAHLGFKYLFIRMGCLALVVAMLLFWRLLTLEFKAQYHDKQQDDFDRRIDAILKGKSL